MPGPWTRSPGRGRRSGRTCGSWSARPPAGFPWLAVAGKLLAGWLVIDLDATLITARSDKEGAAPTFKIRATASIRWGPGCANTAECLAMLLRPGNAGSNTFADHLAVLTAAIRQIPARMRSRLLVRVDGAGASHELIEHLLSLSSRRRTVLFTCGWAITAADEQAIGLLPAGAWQAAVDQDGVVQEDKHVAEITHLLQPGRALARRAAVDRAPHQAVAPAGQEPDRLRARHRLAVLHHLHQHPGRAAGYPACPAATTPSSSTCCTASTPSSRTASAPRNRWACGTLPSKTWLVNCGWVLAANLAADLAAWCRLLGLYDCDDLKDAEPDTLRYRLLSLPARLVRHARARVLKISRTWPWKDAFLACWQRLCALPAPA